MGKEVNAKKFNLVVLARTAYGEDWVLLYEPAKEEADLTLAKSEALALRYLRAHRDGEQGYEYRIKDSISGAILD